MRQIVSVLLLAAAVAIATAKVALAAPVIEVAPPQAEAGSEVTVTGMGFMPGEQIEVFFAGFIYPEVGNLFSGDEGDFTIDIVLDSSVPSGSHPLEVSGDMGSSVSIEYLILAPAPTPTATPQATATPVPPSLQFNRSTVQAGTQFTLSGTGFSPGESVQVIFLGMTYPQSGTLFAGDEGDFELVVPVSASAQPGSYEVSVTGSVNGPVNSSITVTAAHAPTPLPASVQVDPLTAVAGSEVLITGTGFVPREQVVVSFAGTDYPTTGTLFADENGGFSIPIVIQEDVPSGPHPLDLNGSQGTSVTIEYSVQPAPPTPTPVATNTSVAAVVEISPAAAPAGAKVTISGSGFNPGESIEINFAGITYPLTGELFADDFGNFMSTITLDATVPVGSHPLDVTGSGGTTVSIEYGITVGGSTVPPTSTAGSGSIVPTATPVGSITDGGTTTESTETPVAPGPGDPGSTPGSTSEGTPVSFSDVPVWIYLITLLILIALILLGWWWFWHRGRPGATTNGEDDGDDPRDTPPPTIFGEVIDRAQSVEIEGCACIRRDQTETYRAEGAPAGGTYEWSLSDEDIAEFVGGNTGPEVEVKGLDIGQVTLTCVYTLGYGRVRDEQEISVIYHKFTERDQPKSEKAAVPLIQPTALVRIHPRLSGYELADDGIEPERHRAKFLVSFAGRLKDSLIDITGVDVSAGLDFKASLSRSGNEHGRYNDQSFEAKNIEVYGPGRTYVRVKASNNINRWGSDTLEVSISLTAEWERIISNVESSLGWEKERGSSEAVIADAEDRLMRAWEGALQSVTVESNGLVHVRSSVSEAPQRDKWSVAIEADKANSELELKTDYDDQYVSVSEVEEDLLAPDTEPKNYFAIHSDYASERLRWDPDGKLLAGAGEDVELIYERNPCCAHAVPAVGVEIDPKPGVKLLRKDEPLILHGDGKPASLHGESGIYTWSVDAHPDGAEFRFEPEGPTTSQDVKFFTDTPGIYAFKVDYQLAGASGPWTYAVEDAQILFKVETTQTIDRLGNYGDEIADHRDRPYYRDRTVKVQPGAEVLVRERDGGLLGQDLEIEALCPEELVLSTELKARAYYSDAERRDYEFVVDENARFKASVVIRSTRVIQRLHVMGIRYGNLPRRKGDEVWIDVRVRVIPPPVADLGSTAPAPEPADAPAESSGPQSESNAVAVVVNDPIGVTPPEQQNVANPLVNLIMRTRDLGDVDAGQAMVDLGSQGIEVNLTNGNQVIELPLFSTNGAGLSLSPAVFYNSRIAIQQKAIDEYRRLNGKTEDQIEAEFGKMRLGAGWSVSTDIRLFEYVDVDDRTENPRLTRCAEVILPDSNRISFEEVSPGTYHVRSDAEAIGEDPDSALGMVLTRNPDNTWHLEDITETLWTFNEEGLVTEQRDARTRAPGSSLQPMKWEWSDASLKITDSVGRTSEFNFDSSGYIGKVEAPDGTTCEITHGTETVSAVTLQNRGSWGFQYGDHGLMTRVTPPIGHETEFTHYLDGDVEGVAEDIARDFWGRAASMKFGNRRYVIRYERRDDENQVVNCTAPGDYQWRFQYKAERQAIESIEYRNSGSSSWTHFARYSYWGDTKYETTFEDQASFITSYGLSVSPVKGKAIPRTSQNAPDNYLQQYELNDRGLLVRHTDEGEAVTTFEYRPDRQISKITFPAVLKITFDLEDDEEVLVEEYTYDEMGRSVTHTDIDGVVTTYEYGGDGDPHGVGLPTSISTGKFRENYRWDVMGRETESTDHTGQKKTTEYDSAGQPTSVAIGGFQMTFTNDLAGRVVEQSDSLGRSSSTQFDEYGAIASETNEEGNTASYTRDIAGNVTEETGFDGVTHRFTGFDALGRWSTHHLPNVARTGADGLSTENMPSISQRFSPTATQFSTVGMRTSRVIQTVGNSTTTRHFDGRGQLVAEESTDDGQTTVSITKYDPRGNATQQQVRYGNGSTQTLFVNVWDALGRLVSSTVGSATTRYCTSRDGEGIYSVELLPAPSDREGRPPAVVRRYDDNERLVAEFDGNGDVTTTYEYSDDGKTCTVKSVDPSDSSDSPELITTQVLKYNDWGKVEEQTDPLSQVAIRYRFDSAGRLVTVDSPAGSTTFEYDVMDRVVKTQSPVPAAAGAVSTGGGPTPSLPAVTTQTLEVSKSFDAAGRLVSSTSGAATERFSYDDLGRLISVTRDGLGGGNSLNEEIYYNAEGQQSARWFSPGDFVRYAISGDGLKTSEQWSWGGLEGRAQNFSFDPSGNLVGYETDTHSVKLEMRYDAAGRRTGFKVLNNGREIADTSVDYGSSEVPEQLIQSYGGTGRRTSFKYDSNLRIVEIADSSLGFGEKTLFNYNRAGMLTRITRPVSENATTTYSFLPSGAVHRIRHQFGEQWKDTLLTTFDPAAYDNKGNPGTVRHVYSENGADKNVPEFLDSEEHTYDEANRLIGTKTFGRRAGVYYRTLGEWGSYMKYLFPTLTLVIDAVYDRTDDTRAEVDVRYSFDGENRRTLALTTITPDTDSPNEKQHLIHHFKYGSGQAVEEEIQEWYDVGARDPKYIRKKHIYDEQGRRTHTIETVTMTTPGTPGWAKMTRYEFDFGNKPHTVRVLEKRGGRIYPLSVTHSAYDTDDRLIYAKHESFGESTVGDEDHESEISGFFAERSDFQAPVGELELQRTSELHYVYAGNHLVALVDGQGNTVEEYLNGVRTNSRLTIRRRAGITGGWQTADYYNNYEGTSLFLTDGEGEVEQYFPQTGTYGEAVKQVPEAVHASLWPSLSGLFESPARNYDAAAGQFTAPDPIGLMGGINLYSFANNNPVSFKDTTGNVADTAWDVASIGVGFASFFHNVSEGRFGDAVIDSIGIGVDVVAAALPFIPGGAGMFLKGYRTADAALEMAEAGRTIDKLVPDEIGTKTAAAMRNPKGPRDEVLEGAGVRIQSAASRLREIRTGFKNGYRTRIAEGGGQRIAQAASKLKAVRHDAIAGAKAARKHAERLVSGDAITDNADLLRLVDRARRNYHRSLVLAKQPGRGRAAALARARAGTAFHSIMFTLMRSNTIDGIPSKIPMWIDKTIRIPRKITKWGANVAPRSTAKAARARRRPDLMMGAGPIPDVKPWKSAGDYYASTHQFQDVLHATGHLPFPLYYRLKLPRGYAP